MPLVVDIITEDHIDSFVDGSLSLEDALLVADVIRTDPKAARVWRQIRAARAGQGERIGKTQARNREPKRNYGGR